MRQRNSSGPLRVLHVINTLRDGGAEMNVLRLALHADPICVEPHVAFCGKWPLESTLDGSGVHTLRLDDVPRRVRSLATPCIIARLMHYIRKRRIDVVHTHLFNAHAWGAVAASFSRTKLLEHVHDHRYSDRATLGRAVMRQYDRALNLARLSDHIVVLTHQNRDYVLEHASIHPSRVSIVPNGLPQRQARPDSAERAMLRRSLGIAADASMVLAAGRLALEKNFSTLIAALDQIRARVPALRAVILGEGPERLTLQRQVDAAGLTDIVQLPGHSRNMQAYYDVADVFVQPSTFELQSLAMLEAMQAGLPAIVSAGVGSNDEVITNGQTGFLVHPHRTDDWATTIASVLCDAPLRTRVGEAGRTLVQRNCDIRQIALRFERLYTELCGN